jgi:FAD/FMN-containing dehydrogenase
VSGELDPRGLAGELARAVRGEVRFSAGSRALYATDASNYRQAPIGVVLPRDGDDIVAAVSICAEHCVAILPRGGGTALAGQTCNAAVVLDCSRHLDEIFAPDPQRRTARVQPGVVLDDLRAAAERLGLTFGPDPASHDHCTLWGMMGNHSCGVHSIMSGRTVENIDELDVLLHDGTRLRVGTAGDETELDGVVAAGGRRATAEDTLILADGFSCREQIRQGTDRQALHLAELLQLALHTDANGDRA